MSMKTASTSASYSYDSTLSVKKNYSISMYLDVFNLEKTLIAQCLRGGKSFIVFDSGAGVALRSQIEAYFTAHNLQYSMRIISGGETSKHSQLAESLAEEIVAFGLHRGEYVIGVGGGATLDLVSYTASRVHRGVACMNIPTTFLSQVDAGVGVKNAVNFAGYKNTLGTFYPPSLVIVDPTILLTLPARQVSSGIAEAIKVSIMLNRELFELIENNYSDVIKLNIKSPVVQKIIWETILTHVRQIETDPFEQAMERPLVFGHEWGHWLEIKTDHRLTHGEAISIGMAIDSHIALSRGLMLNDEYNRILSILRKCALPIFDRWIEKDMASGCNELYAGLVRHQEHQYGTLSPIALPKCIGSVAYVSDISQQDLFQAVSALCDVN